jgi:RNA polymerase sigma factor for flagellar operon FliA
MTAGAAHHIDSSDIAKHAAKAKRIARSFMKKLPRSVQFEDIEQAALIGVWDALRRNPDTSQPGYEWYLSQRISGSIIDELRKQDWLPRRAREAARVENDRPRRYKTLNRPPAVVVRFDDIGSNEDWLDTYAGPSADPTEALIAKQEAAEALRAPLGERGLRLVDLVFFKGKLLKEAADQFGVSEPRIGQLHAKGLNVMRAHLTGNLTDLPCLKSGAQIPLRTQHLIQDYHDRLAANQNDRRAAATAGVSARGPRRASADPPPVRAGGVGGPTHRVPARSVPGRGPVLELVRAARAALPEPLAQRANRDAGPDIRRSGSKRAEPGRCAPGPDRRYIDTHPSERRVQRLPTEGTAAMKATLPEEGVDLRAELVAYQSELVAQALARSGGNRAAAARLLRVSPLELTRMEAKARRPCIGALPALPAPSTRVPAADMPQIRGGLEVISRAAIRRMTAEGLTPGQIASRLGVNPYVVEKVQRAEAELAKCGPVPPRGPERA